MRPYYTLGFPEPITPHDEEDLFCFWTKVDRRGPDECWPWLGCKEDGYGRIRWEDNKAARAHIVAYTLQVGPVPPGHDLHHTCRHRDCMNPAHMQPITHAEHSRLPKDYPWLNITHCPHGHAYSPENTYVDKKHCRHCRTCRNERWLSPYRQAHRRGT